MDLRVKAAVVALALNGVLVGLKAFLWRISGSTAVAADALHSLSDLMISVFVIAGLGLSRRGEKQGAINWRGIERVVELVVGASILYTAVEIAARAVTGPLSPVRNLAWTIAGEAVCACVAYLTATMEIRAGRATASPSLVADGYHTKMDVYSTVAVIVGLSGAAAGIGLERAAAVAVSLLVVLTGLEIVTGSVKALAKGTPVADYFVSRLFAGREDGGAGGRLPAAVAGIVAWLRRGRRYAFLAAGLALALWLGSGFYSVVPGDTGIVFRFGRIAKAAVRPGLHFHRPFPIERVAKLPTQVVRRVEIGFRTAGDSLGTDTAYQWESRHQTGNYIKRVDESLMFTGDESIADINSVVQYRVSQPAKYLLAIEDGERFVRCLTEAALMSISSQIALEDMLTTQRRDIEESAKSAVQGLLDQAGSGIEIVSLRLQDVHPPIEVVDAFRDVASAREDMHAIINRAGAYADSLIPQARGQAEEMITLAGAERNEAVEHATGEAQRFVSVMSEYEQNRQVTELRMYLETMEKTLPGIRKFLVEPEPGGEPLDLRFFGEGLTSP
ncbi:MAG: FtsH protease activity modulator HflK [bacterium]